MIRNRDTYGIVGGMSGKDTAGGNDTVATVEFTLRVPVELATRIGVAAAKERKSRAQWIREALQLVVERVENRNA